MTAPAATGRHRVERLRARVLSSGDASSEASSSRGLPPAAGSLRRTRAQRLARAIARTAALLVLTLPGCAPAAGPFVLEAAAGRVVDEDTGEPIRDATVIEWYRGAGRFGGPQPSIHARFATTGRDGRFAFEREIAPSLRIWALETYGPVYGFYHPSYGLEMATPRRVGTGTGTGEAAPSGEAAPTPQLLFQGSLRRAHLRLDALRPYCDGQREDDAAAPHLREIACPLERHARWPSGVPRAEGPVDAQGRRTGAWTFRYENGDVAARGAYQAGGATGDWEFYDRSESGISDPDRVTR